VSQAIDPHDELSEAPPPGQNVHEYDGILEYDNQLPRWWLTAFAICVLFSGAYWLYYHTYDKGLHPSEEYAEFKTKEAEAEAAKLAAAGEVNDEVLATMAKNPASVAQGKEIFAAQCVTCHAEGGKGAVGPNLTDDYVLHGGKAMDTYKIVREGYLAKQMPAWGKQLGEAKVRSVVAYVVSIRGTNVAGGKEPQGERL
jgi:cytochrome c oxidase cbb3-type subunit 3